MKGNIHIYGSIIFQFSTVLKVLIALEIQAPFGHRNAM